MTLIIIGILIADLSLKVYLLIAILPKISPPKSPPKEARDYEKRVSDWRKQTLKERKIVAQSLLTHLRKNRRNG